MNCLFSMDVGAYLRRIEYHGASEPSSSALRQLHRQHLFTIPFENLDIPLGVPIRLDIDGIFDKIVSRRRGGFCYELNGLFCQLLRELGFRVQMLSARVRREDGGFGPEFDHMLLKVELEEPWLVDVGFGDSFVDPIVFRAGGVEPGSPASDDFARAGMEDRVNGYRYIVSPVGEEWHLLREDDKGEVPLYAFRNVPRQFGDYEAMCHFHQTSPESHFTKSWICSRATKHGRITLANMRLIVTNAKNREEITLSTEGDLRRCLHDAFGVEFEASAELSRLMA